ncbi:PCYCGC motif-containing (lipo)protein [Fictibacillus sp. S7]|uniref:PCYCGC motif-containing (lipo)protein n=1 Tax=Fictibacillus sp. S7 TaxID=2212476 RepID=UPI0010105676|nr:PCYCGC motif-containing (lipo)protein [Fictibacillus sp. S7]RXZ02156.1 hypothetical protein DMO16_22345 [Fictibacillus sp. S7]
MKRTSLISLVLIVSLSLLVACSNEKEKPSATSEQHSQHASTGAGDIREETGKVDVLPTFLTDKPKEIQVIYQAAAKNKELLEKIPCYCGCGESVNHKNNYDCFVHENKNGGSIVWDDHGTKCDVCLQIAAQSMKDFNEGMSLKEIRKKIDNLYQEGYAKPTPTPKI